MELYIVRHGKTIWNAAGRTQGHTDIELNEEGKAAALAFGEKMKNTPFDVIYSSPLKRAYKTAELIRGEMSCPIITDNRLIEISFGDMEGLPYDTWLDEACPYHYFFSEPAKYIAPPNGETLEEVCARTKEFLTEVIEPLVEKESLGANFLDNLSTISSNTDNRSDIHSLTNHLRILIVAHGALNKGLMCHLEGNDIAHFWGDGLQKNCEATIFTYSNGIWSRK